MLRSIQQRDLDRNRWVKISMTVILLVICASMLVYLIPGLSGGALGGPNPEAVATVGGEDISVVDFQHQMDMQTRGQNIPPILKGYYAKQTLDGIVFQHALDLEAQRLGIQVTSQEITERIKQILPTVFDGDTWLKDRYATELQMKAGMTIPEFERMLRDAMLAEKFRQIVTDGITVTPEEIQQEFRRRNEKAQVEYTLIKPSDIAPTIHPSDSDLAAYYAKNASRYQVPEKRSARYALLDLAALRQHAQGSDDALRAYYNAHLNEYKVENRVHAEHILFKTIGKTDAEVAEIRQKAEDVLKQAKHGGNFEDLAKKYSEDDGTKPKGGDLGWIVEGQTVPEFQQAAFSLPKGSISNLVKTQYGFHIIKVLDRETAHTKTFEEVRDQIQPILTDQKATAQADNLSNELAAAVRQSNRQPLDDLAKKFSLTLGDVPPVAVTEPAGALGNSQEAHQALFQLRPGELSQPFQTDQGWVILTVKDIQPAHQGTLAEVHDRVLADYQQDKATELAQQKAAELAKNAQGGQSFDKAAKALDLTTKTPEAFARDGSIPDVGSAKLLESAFGSPVGQVSAPVSTGGNWLVYRVVSHVPVNQDDFAKQSQDIQQKLLQGKQEAAFEAFHAALVDRLKNEGKLIYHPDVLKRFTESS